MKILKVEQSSNNGLETKKDGRKEALLLTNDLLGVINLGTEQGLFPEFTKHRNLASVPFSGRYRLIDFTLTNMITQNISQVGIFTLENSRSLMDHLGSGKEWDLDRSQGGLHIFPPALKSDGEAYLGDLANFSMHREHFVRSKQPYVVITGSNVLTTIDYNDMLDHHKSIGADITLAYTSHEQKCGYCRPIRLGENDRVVGISERGFSPDDEYTYTETIIMSKNLFLRLVDEATSKGEYDLLDGVIRPQLHRLHVHGYHYVGKMQVIHSVLSYYNESMRLLRHEGIIYDFPHIYTKIKHEPPTRYLKGSKVNEALVANGCKIHGEVQNSILFRGVSIGKHARVKNSIISSKSVIEEGAVVENAILDKEVIVKRGQVIRGTVDEPIVIGKRTTV